MHVCSSSLQAFLHVDHRFVEIAASAEDVRNVDYSGDASPDVPRYDCNCPRSFGAAETCVRITQQSRDIRLIQQQQALQPNVWVCLKKACRDFEVLTRIGNRVMASFRTSDAKTQLYK